MWITLKKSLDFLEILNITRKIKIITGPAPVDDFFHIVNNLCINVNKLKLKDIRGRFWRWI